MAPRVGLARSRLGKRFSFEKVPLEELPSVILVVTICSTFCPGAGLWQYSGLKDEGSWVFSFQQFRKGSVGVREALDLTHPPALPSQVPGRAESCQSSPALLRWAFTRAHAALWRT